MKSLKMICTTTLLVLAFTIPGLAGEINTPGFTQDPNVISLPTSETEENGDDLQQNTLDGELETSAWTAILVTLSALF
jgi:hypothetical protein